MRPNRSKDRRVSIITDDEVNVVLLQLIGEDMAFSPQGFSGIGPVITFVPNAELEKEFYLSVLDLENVGEEVLQGPQIEAMIALPAGSELDFSIWGHPSASFGRVEVISYSGVEGADLFSRISPKARGILHVSYHTDHLAELVDRLEASNTTFERHGKVTTLASSGETISFHSPAGFRIEAVQND